MFDSGGGGIVTRKQGRNLGECAVLLLGLNCSELVACAKLTCRENADYSCDAHNLITHSFMKCFSVTADRIGVGRANSNIKRFDKLSRTERCGPSGNGGRCQYKCKHRTDKGMEYSSKREGASHVSKGGASSSPELHKRAPARRRRAAQPPFATLDINS
ncbi:unnamed protein product, partial [Iphiclides podalirius]